MTQYTEILEGMQVLLVTEDPARAEALSRALRDHKAHVGDLKAGRREPTGARGADLLLLDSRIDGQTSAWVNEIRKDVRARWAANLSLDFSQLVREDGSVHFGLLKDAATPLVEPDRALTERAQKETSFTTRLAPLGPSRTLRALSFAGHTLQVELRHATLTASVEIANELLVCASAKREGTEWEAWQALVRILGLSDAEVTVSRRAYPSGMNIMEPVHQALEVAAQERQCAAGAIEAEEASAEKPASAGAAAPELPKPSVPMPPPPPPGARASRPQRTLLGVAPGIPALGKAFTPQGNIPAPPPPSKGDGAADPRYTHRAGKAAPKLKPGLTLMGMAAPQLPAKPGSTPAVLGSVPPANTQTGSAPAAPPNVPPPAPRRPQPKFKTTQPLTPGAFDASTRQVPSLSEAASASQATLDDSPEASALAAQSLEAAEQREAAPAPSAADDVAAPEPAAADPVTAPPDLAAAPTERPPPGAIADDDDDDSFDDGEVTVVADEQAVNALREQALQNAEASSIPEPKPAPPDAQAPEEPALELLPAAEDPPEPQPIPKPADSELPLGRSASYSEPPSASAEETLVVKHDLGDKKRSPVLMAGLGLLLLAAAGGAFFFYQQQQKEAPQRQSTTTLDDLRLDAPELAAPAEDPSAAEPEPEATPEPTAADEPKPAAPSDEPQAVAATPSQQERDKAANAPARDEEAEELEPQAEEDELDPDKSGESDEADAEADLSPKDAYALARRGLRELNQGDLAAAQQSFELAKTADAHNPHAYDGLARVFLRMEKLPEAKEAAERAVSLRSRRSRYQVLLGDILKAQGDAAGARRAFQKALEIDPDDRAAQRRLGM